MKFLFGFVTGCIVAGFAVLLLRPGYNQGFKHGEAYGELTGELKGLQYAQKLQDELTQTFRKKP